MEDLVRLDVKNGFLMVRYMDFNVYNLYMVNFSINKLDQNKHSFTILVGLISVFISIWFILDAFPGLVASLFNTILGNLIIVLSIILVGIKNIQMALGLIILFVFLFKFSHYVKEGMGLFSKSGIYKFAT
jgi:hypothetical protein